MGKRIKMTGLDAVYEKLKNLHEQAKTESQDSNPSTSYRAQLSLEVLGDVLELVDTARATKVDPAMREKRQAAWFEAALRLCGGTKPPFVPYNGRSKHVVEKGWNELISHFLNYGPDWTTGIGAVEALDHMVDEAESNGNFDIWDHTAVLARMKGWRIKVRGTSEDYFHAS